MPSMRDLELYRAAQEARARALPVAYREMNRIRAFGFPNIHPLSSVDVGINTPDINDIDFIIGSTDVVETSKELDRLGIPFSRQIQTRRVHTYRTPEGYAIDVKVRPQREVDFAIPGYARMRAMSESDKVQIISEKQRLKDAGDVPGYIRYKHSIYEKYGAIPPGGDWSLVKNNPRRTRSF